MDVFDLKAKIRHILEQITKGFENEHQSYKNVQHLNFTKEEKRDFVQLLHHLKYFLEKSDIDEALHTLPDTGQLLGRLCCMKNVLADPQLYQAIMRCVLCLYKQNPTTQLEKKAKGWVLAQLRNAVCLSEKQDYVVCKFGIERLAILKEQLRLSWRNISQHLKKTQNDENMSQDYVHYQAVGIDSTLKSVILEMLLLPYSDDLSPLWEDLLEILSSYQKDDPAFLMVYHKLDEIQKESYNNDDAVPRLSSKCCYYLWSNYLPSLEQAVLQMVRDVSQFTLFTNVNDCIQRSHMVSICAEDHHIYLLVTQMLDTLLVASGGSPVVVGVISSLNHYIQQYLRSINNPAYLTDSYCHRYSGNVKALVNLLLVNPNDLSIAQTESHIDCIAECIRKISSNHGNIVCHKCLLHFKPWHMKSVQLCLQCDKKYVPECLDLVLCFHQLLDQTQIKKHLHDLVLCLRPLVIKTSLGWNDVKYALTYSQLDVTENQTAPVIGQILINFMFQSSGGIFLANQILELVTKTTKPVDHLEVLLNAHCYLQIDFSTWSPYKLQHYITYVENLLSVLQEQPNEHSDRKSSEIISAANQFLLCVKKSKLKQ